MRASDLRPNFLVIGAAKCGTTSLCEVLAEHPDVFVSHPKEPHFFSLPDRWGRGWEWYDAHFAGAGDAFLRGEGSTTYTEVVNYPETAERIARHLPGVKLLYVVRHPIERIESHWRYQRWRHGGVPASFSEALERLPHIVDSSRYWKQIDAYRRHVPDERIRLLFLEDMKVDPEGFFRGVLEFLGADPEAIAEGASRPRNVSDGQVRALGLVRLLWNVDAALPWLTRVRTALVPKRVRSALRARATVTMDDRPEWDPALLRRTADALADDVSRFLRHAGKPADFWDLGRR